MKTCPNQKENLANCNCSYEPCERKGVCCACIVSHRKQGELPACYFSAEAERTYDRSVAAFLKMRR